MLTASLEKAFTEASKLSEDEQDALVDWILEELESEHLWDKAFSDSFDKLAKLAEKALAEHKKGKTSILDPDKL